MADVPVSPIGNSLPEYKDRTTGLTVFGIVEILLGCLAGVLIVLMIFGQLMIARATQQPPQLRLIIPGALFYGMMAVVLITLGIGSLRARRWARALSLVLSWSWLVTGVLVTLVIVPITLEDLQRFPGAVPALKAVVLGAFAMIGLLFILVPGILILFYQSRHVKATCETRDPVRRWTDACPLPVLALSLWIGFGALCLLVMPLSMNGVLPFFGVLLSGWIGSLGYLAMAGLWGYSAWALYRLKVTGWWIVLVSLILFSVSAWISFSQIDLVDLYQQMGYSDSQIQMMEQFNLTGRNIGYLSLAGVVPLLVYLLFVKRFFGRTTVG